MQKQLTQRPSYAIRFSYGTIFWLKSRYSSIITFLLLSSLLAIFFVQGFENGSVNNFRDQSVQIPIISSYADSSLYSDDFLLDARHSYVTWFYPALGAASRVIPLHLVMLYLYEISILLTIGAIYAMAEALFPRRNVGIFAVVLWMAYYPNPGGDFTHSPFVTHSTFAIALNLWAIVFILKRKYLPAALIIGAVANINAMTSFFVAILWFFAVIENRRGWLLNLFKGGLLMGLASLPILWWRFSQPFTEASLEQYQEIIRTRLWYAVFPFSISIELWLGFAVLLLLWLYSFRYSKPKNHRQILYMVSGIMALCVLGMIFTEIIPVEFVIELQPIRSTWLINLFIMLYLAHMIRQLLVSSRWQQYMKAFLVIGVFVVARWVIEIFPPLQPTPYKLYADLDIAWMQNHSMLAGSILLIVLMALYPTVQRLTHPSYSRRAIVWISFAIVGFVIPGFLPSRIPPQQHAMTRSWAETLSWIEQSTPNDAQFLTPATMDGFRVGARRAHIGDWKDGTVGIFYNGWAIEWYQRMISLGFDPQTFSFKPLNQDRICFAAAYYQVNYVVVFRRDAIRGKPVFQNDEFEVIPVENLVCATLNRGMHDPE
jgi:hypothetical protein